MCQWASIRPGISVLPVPSIVTPRRCVEPACVTEVMSPSEIATSNGPVIRPLTLSKTLTFEMNSDCGSIGLTLVRRTSRAPQLVGHPEQRRGVEPGDLVPDGPCLDCFVHRRDRIVDTHVERVVAAEHHVIVADGLHEEPQRVGTVGQ